MPGPRERIGALLQTYTLQAQAGTLIQTGLDERKHRTLRAGNEIGWAGLWPEGGRREAEKEVLI